MTPESKSAIYSGLFMAGVMGCWFVMQFSLLAGLVSGISAGALFGGLIYLFINSKKVSQQTAIETHNGDAVLFSGPANHFKNGEGAGGKLYLLQDRLQFKSHRFNIQNHEWQIRLGAIDDVTIYNILGIIPTGFRIETSDGKTERFVVNNRMIWRSAILEAKAVCA